MANNKLRETVTEELQITMNLACYIAGILDAHDRDTLTQAKDALLENHKLITHLYNELEQKENQNGR